MNVALDVDVRRTFDFAGRMTELQNTKFVRRCLSIELGDRFSGTHFTVKWIGHVDRTGIRTLTAGIAFRFIDISWRDLDFSPKITRFPLQTDEFGKGEYLNIDIAGTFDQFGGYNTGSAIAGRKRLVKLSHHAADGRITLNKIDFKSGISKVEGCLNTGDAAALNQNSTC